MDLGRLDSVSGRVSYAPTRQLIVQVSAAHLHEAEAEFAPDPRSDVDRATASATYHRLSGDSTFWVTTLAYGVNSAREIVPGDAFDAVTHAVMLETTLARGNYSWSGRAEAVQKPAHDLHFHEYPVSVFTVGRVQLGYVRQLPSRLGITSGIGATVSLNLVPTPLTPRYERHVAPSFGIFVSARPPRHQMR